MPMERHDTCLRNVPIKIKKEEVRLTFQKPIEDMLKQKEQRMEDP
jgi:hypothetical protein